MTLDDALEKIPSSFDRYQEAHFWLHSMERSYHIANEFRWSLNAFIRALNEVPSLIKMELQNVSGFKKWFKTESESLKNDPLISLLSRERNFIVHRAMLMPCSKGALGLKKRTEFKISMEVQINPLEDSDLAVRRYLSAVHSGGDFLGLLQEEDFAACVKREWKIKKIDDELLEVCSKALLRIQDTLRHVLEWIGSNPPRVPLDCRLPTDLVFFKYYDRETLNKWYEEMKEET